MSEEKNNEVNTKQLMMVVGIAVVALAAFVAIYFGTTGYFKHGNPQTAAVSPTPAVTAAQNTAAPTTSAPAADNAVPKASSGTAASASASPKAVIQTKYNFEQAMKMAQEVAKKQFGDDAVVFPADEGIAEMINIDGVDRPCFRFGADSMSKIAQNQSMRGKYHFDANTGEVFNYDEGKMTKVN